MKTKPRYRSMRAHEVTPGMRVYSLKLGECFTVETVKANGWRVELREGLYTMLALVDYPLWVEMRP